MNKRFIGILKILFLIHFIQNTVGFFNLVNSSPGNTLIYSSAEFLGGLFSLACVFFLNSQTKDSYRALLIRCLTGIFSFGTVITLMSLSYPEEVTPFSLLRLWPPIMFAAAVYFLGSNKNDYKKDGSYGFKYLTYIFIVLVLLNWFPSALLFFVGGKFG